MWADDGIVLPLSTVRFCVFVRAHFYAMTTGVHHVLSSASHCKGVWPEEPFTAVLLHLQARYS